MDFKLVEVLNFRDGTILFPSMLTVDKTAIWIVKL